MAVGISHSSYQPLDDAVTIPEEFVIVAASAGQIPSSSPYPQAFADVNKRTSLVASNIPLLRSILVLKSITKTNDADYIDGLIGIYELNNVALLRDVFIKSYLASAEKYGILRAEVEQPEKAALAYREFLRATLRSGVQGFLARRGSGDGGSRRHP
jgi:hypothetical protein